jgi:hypothetical protein
MYDLLKIYEKQQNRAVKNGDDSEKPYQQFAGYPVTKIHFACCRRQNPTIKLLNLISAIPVASQFRPESNLMESFSAYYHTRRSSVSHPCRYALIHETSLALARRHTLIGNIRNCQTSKCKACRDGSVSRRRKKW